MFLKCVLGNLATTTHYRATNSGQEEGGTYGLTSRRLSLTPGLSGTTTRNSRTLGAEDMVRLERQIWGRAWRRVRAKGRERRVAIVGGLGRGCVAAGVYM